MIGARTAGKPSPAAPDPPLVKELALRAVGAAFQVVSTWTVVRAIDPESAGIYFRGWVIACGVAALVRAKYELFAAHHIIAQRDSVDFSTGVLLRQLGRRVLLRSSLACAALLVVMADIDIQAPRLQPALETYLPFVLAIPFISLSRFVGEALRAANRTLSGTVITSYALNLSILAVALVPTGASLAIYVWTFFIGGIASAALAVVLALRVFPGDWKQGARPIPPEVLQAADDREVIALGRALLLWGPLAVLAVFSTAVQMAEYAAAARTAMIVDFFLPALNLSGSHDLRRPSPSGRPSHVLLMEQLRGSLFISSAFVTLLSAAAPMTLAVYGLPYRSQLLVYMLLLGEQWINSVGRPAVRYAALASNVPRARSAVGSSALAALFVSCSAVNLYGALAVAAATVIGAIILNLWAIIDALMVSDSRSGRRSCKG